MVDARDLKSLGPKGLSRFKSGRPHQMPAQQTEAVVPELLGASICARTPRFFAPIPACSGTIQTPSRAPPRRLPRLTKTSGKSHSLETLDRLIAVERTALSSV